MHHVSDSFREWSASPSLLLKTGYTKHDFKNPTVFGPIVAHSFIA